MNKTVFVTTMGLFIWGFLAVVAPPDGSAKELMVCLGSLTGSNLACQDKKINENNAKWSQQNLFKLYALGWELKGVVASKVKLATVSSETEMVYYYLQK